MRDALDHSLTDPRRQARTARMLARRTRRGRCSALAAVLVRVVLVSGCGSGGDSAAESTPTTPAARDTASQSTTTTATDSSGDDDSSGGDGCDLVSDDVVNTVLGVDIGRREPHEDAAGTSISCIKGTERPSDMTQASYVSVALFAGSGAAVADAAVESGATPVDGVGDRAVFLASAGMLVVVDGQDGLQVQVVNGRGPSTVDDAVTVANDVLEHRP